jgi:hypothetical protein
MAAPDHFDGSPRFAHVLLQRSKLVLWSIASLANEARRGVREARGEHFREAPNDYEPSKQVWMDLWRRHLGRCSDRRIPNRCLASDVDARVALFDRIGTAIHRCEAEVPL